jgi:hypothetical protein
MTSDDYIAALEEIAVKKQAVQAKRERKREEAEHEKVQRAGKKAEVEGE